MNFTLPAGLRGLFEEFLDWLTPDHPQKAEAVAALAAHDAAVAHEAETTAVDEPAEAS
jgi:hypothetical protein